MTLFLVLRIVYAAGLVATTIVGLRLGGRSERAGAIIVLAASLATLAIERLLPFEWHGHRIGLIAVDVAVLFAFFHLTLITQRFWPLWATAFHLIAVCSHWVVQIGSSRILQVYVFFQGFWAYPIMFLIILGALSRRRRAIVMARSVAIEPSNRRSISSRAPFTD